MVRELVSRTDVMCRTHQVPNLAAITAAPPLADVGPKLKNELKRTLQAQNASPLTPSSSIDLLAFAAVPRAGVAVRRRC